MNMKTFFDNQETTKGDRDQQIQDQANRIRNVGQQEARDGVTISTEEDINFFTR
jgi:hypothetical protein